MLAKTTLALVLVSLSSYGASDNGTKWKDVSTSRPGIQFKWSRPARNSCEVTFRDLQLVHETTLSATITYHSHRTAKDMGAEDVAALTIGAAGSVTEHISNCAAVADVAIQNITRR
jgi:hypothetical protein